MLLKKLTIAGFKSFADRVTITFDQGVTGVVGPNGSGKSNIIDAVRWVMGEQSAKNLRGDKSTDIIFAGSDKRKPLSMAEVTITFDNSDAGDVAGLGLAGETEISITRRLYADGEREYLINRKACRFRDIVNFFAITGLGGRSYSMIQQGQVERILSARPEVIREILEEAAGTLVYRTRKQEAERRLDITRTYLSRVDDILSEVNVQIDALKNQVDKANEWRTLSAEIKTLDIRIMAHNWHHFSATFNEIEAERDAQSVSEIEHMTTLARFEGRHVELRSKISEAIPGLEQLSERLGLTKTIIARTEGKLHSAQKMRESAAQNLQSASYEFDEESGELERLTANIGALERQLAKEKNDLEDLNEALAHFEDAAETVNEKKRTFDSRGLEIEETMRDVTSSLTSSRSRIESLNRDLQREKRELDSESTRLAAIESEVKSAKEKLTDLDSRLAEHKGGLESELRDKHQREAAVASRISAIRDMDTARDEARDKFYETRARHGALVEILAEETSTAAAMAHLRDIGVSESLCPSVLVDAVAIREGSEKLPEAASAAFEGWCERLLVPDLKALDSIIAKTAGKDVPAVALAVASEWKRADQATIRAWATRHKIVALTDYVSLLNPIAAPIVENLFLCLHDNLPEAAYKTFPAGIAVFWASGAYFSGPADHVLGVRASAGRLSKKAEVEELVKEMQLLEEESEDCAREVERLQELQNRDREVISQIDTQLLEKNRAALEITTEAQAVRSLLTHKSDLAGTAGIKVRELRESVALNEEELERKGAAVELCESDLAVLEGELEEMTSERDAIDDEYQEMLNTHNDRKVQQASVSTRIVNQESNLAQYRDSRHRLATRKQRKEEERTRLEASIAASIEQEGEAQSEIEAQVRTRDDLEKSLTVLREANSALIAEDRAIEDKLKETRETQNTIQRLMSQKDLDLSRLSGAIKNIAGSAFEKYAMQIAEHRFEVDAKFDQGREEGLLARHKKKLEGMGAVNVMAIEEYEKLVERQAFILEQKGEVSASIALIEDAIDEIESSSRTKFLKTFTVINKNFAELFPILFPGGEGTLALTDEQNPLAGGVEIFVRLPGKTRKSMSLFSGGEKALTAISLIFALLKTKPTPFSFLDEVDAPLDEANVGRFNAVIAALAAQFQFVIITHNRRTMEVLDTLYGVTMMEGGVSKIVGVDLKKDLPPHLQKAPERRTIEGASVHG